MKLNNTQGKGLKLKDTFESPIINFLKFGDEMIKIEVFILSQLVRLVDFYTCKLKPTTIQLESLAEICIEKFPYLSIEDYPVFVKNCIGGGCHSNGEYFQFGKAYDHLDSQMILEWLNSYVGAKEAEREVIHRESKSDFNKITKEGMEILNKVMKPHERPKQQRTISWNGENLFENIIPDEEKP